MKQLQQVTFSDLTKEKPAEIPDDSNAASDNIMGLYWASQALFVPLEQITEVNVKKAYHQLSLLAHPDKNPGNKSEATSAMAVLSKAKAIFESHLAKKKVVELKPEEISRNRAIVLDLLALHNDLKGRNGDFTEKNLFIEDILSKMAGYDVRQEITDQLIKQAIEKNKSSFKELSDGFSDRYKFSEKSSVGGGLQYSLGLKKANFTNAIDSLKNTKEDHNWGTHKNPNIRDKAYKAAKEQVASVSPEMHESKTYKKY